MKPGIRYCAVYTRKSSEEGLDMEFNSLHAQREACLAYITSQKAEGWVPVLEGYDDGGFSGGNIERPGLKQLLADIEAGKIHIVVVYKIDRLTRSLMDFAKLVETFDKYGVTFVSVTQSFNTTTSMGRLTLNVLLSFAQFEREVTGERIRDKFAASKQKGIWMGGTLPLGYRVEGRQLHIVPHEAEKVRGIYQRYLEIGCINDLKRDLIERNVRSRQHPLENGGLSPGCKFTRGALYHLLTNPIYIGKIRHKDKVYQGQHPALMPEDLWNKVQEELKTKAVTARGIRKEREECYLRGRLYDFQGTRYSPTYTNKKGRRYRYYISQNLLQGDDHPKQLIARIPTFEIESRVEKGIRDQLCNGNHAALLFALDWESDQMLLRQIAKKQDLIPAKRLLMESVEKVVVGVDTITVQFKVKELLRLLADLADVHIPSREEISDIHELNLSYVPQKANYGAVLIEPMDEKSSVKPADPFDLPPTELKNLVRGHIWREEHFKGKTIRQIAAREKFSEGFVAKCILKTFDLV